MHLISGSSCVRLVFDGRPAPPLGCSPLLCAAPVFVLISCLYSTACRTSRSGASHNACQAFDWPCKWMRAPRSSSSASPHLVGCMSTRRCVEATQSLVHLHAFLPSAISPLKQAEVPWWASAMSSRAAAAPRPAKQLPSRPLRLGVGLCAAQARRQGRVVAACLLPYHAT